MIYALGIEFVGTDYRGWQKQYHDPCTVQSTLEHALSKIANQSIDVVAAGRTDAGVHASLMIAHFATNAQRSTYNWLHGTNSLLPKNIAVRFITPMPDEFHARFSANARRYQYCTLNSTHRSALLFRQVTHHYTALDVKKMQQACYDLLGTHDFSSFRASSCQSNQPIRHILHANLYQQNGLIVLDIEANGFLHHMVRNIMGALFAIGEHKLPVNAIKILLNAKDRRQAPPTASPDGLYFVGASYPKQLQMLLPYHYAPPLFLS